MKTSAYLSLLLFLTPLVSAQEGEPARTGQGAGIYEVVRDWPNYPPGKRMGSLHGDMAADSQGSTTT